MEPENQPNDGVQTSEPSSSNELRAEALLAVQLVISGIALFLYSLGMSTIALAGTLVGGGLWVMYRLYVEKKADQKSPQEVPDA